MKLSAAEYNALRTTSSCFIELAAGSKLGRIAIAAGTRDP